MLTHFSGAAMQASVRKPCEHVLADPGNRFNARQPAHATAQHPDYFTVISISPTPATAPCRKSPDTVGPTPDGVPE